MRSEVQHDALSIASVNGTDLKSLTCSAVCRIG
jgi:hypothetical protein